jgi:hypothetical protein
LPNSVPVQASRPLSARAQPTVSSCSLLQSGSLLRPHSARPDWVTDRIQRLEQRLLNDVFGVDKK